MREPYSIKINFSSMICNHFREIELATVAFTMYVSLDALPLRYDVLIFNNFHEFKRKKQYFVIRQWCILRIRYLFILTKKHVIIKWGNKIFTKVAIFLVFLLFLNKSYWVSSVYSYAGSHSFTVTHIFISTKINRLNNLIISLTQGIV